LALSNNGAPVCPISRDQAVSGQPALRTPIIPVAVDLPTAIQALQQIQNVLIQMAVPPVVNNIGFPFGPVPLPTVGNPKQDNNGGGGGQKQDWEEDRRCYEVIRVCDPDDRPDYEDNWVDMPVLRWLLYVDQNKQDMQLEYLLNR
jgi:hypothetical protein